MYLCIILLTFKQKFLDKSDDMITYFSRCGICAAWSFNALEETCTLHTTDACCGQLDKREQNSDCVSGYICPQCSSTRNNCPCNLRIRRLGCPIAQSVKKPQYVGTCAVEFRQFTNRRTGRTRCRSVKPQCATTIKGGKEIPTLHQPCPPANGANNGCTDKRRCRERKLSLTRFPRC